jgi:type II secretory pathway pseudopilin PulG
MLRHATTGRSAFSLLELLVVMVMLITLSVVFLGGGRKGAQDRKLRQCEANLQKIHIALTIYAGDHDGAFPHHPEATQPAAPLSALAPTYTSDTDIFICPGTNDAPLPAGKSFAKRNIS